ncbi:MAG: FadR family transcriptional regulator, partial [Synergistaceae bacterium]|nr:FadR family transcriptional regulator [Synergistaceae bacterium]
KLQTNTLLAHKIEEELLRFIQETPVNIGERIPTELDLSKKFNAGRSTIREAVKSLASKGVLEVRQGAGTFVVNSSTVEDDPLRLSRYHDKLQLALELFDVRLMIEPEIAALAAQNASGDDIIEIKNLCDEVEKIYLSGNNHVRKDIEFHKKIAHSSKNRVVEELIPLIISAVYTFANVTHRLLLHETIETHRAITDAISRHDQTGARCAMEMHLIYNRQMILKLMKQEANHEK